MNRKSYRANMQKLVADAADRYKKACFISVSDPYHIVIEMLQNANVDENKFIVVEANGAVKESKTIGNSTYIVPIKDLFKVYLFLRNLIKDNGIDTVLLDSVSSLIENYGELPLQKMLTDLLLEVGAFRCSSSLVVFNEHQNHNVVSHLGPFFGKSMVMY